MLESPLVMHFRTLDKVVYNGKVMKLIVGLGNPGSKYEKTRHNLGRRIAQYLEARGLTAQYIKPTHYMNESGREIAEKVRYYKADPRELLVIQDELDLPFGEMKLQCNRGTAGHNGIESVTNELGTNGYYRLRLGIGPRIGPTGEKFVLENFTDEEEEKIEKEIEPAAREMVSAWLEEQ